MNRNKNAGGGSAGTGPTSNDAGKGGKSPGAGGAQDSGEGGVPAAYAGASGGTTLTDGGDGAMPVAGDGPLGEAGGPGVSTCNGYAEQDDGGNNALPPSAGAAETTGQSLATGVEVCGRIDSMGGSGDVDSYRFAVAQAGQAYFQLEMGTTLAAELVELIISNNEGSVQSVRVTSQDARWWMKVEAGFVTVSLSVENPTAPNLARPYVLSAKSDDVAARCPAVGGGTPYDTVAEAGDGAGNTGNDVIRPSLSADLQTLTASTADMVEANGVNVWSDERSLASGTLANVDHGAGDPYLDGDMFGLSPHGSAQLTFRLDWQQSNADLDIWVFRADDMRAIAHTHLDSKTGPEFLTISPDLIVGYWVWVGAKRGSTLPKAYELTICGEGN